MKPIMGIALHDVPENRPPADFDHGFGAELGLFAEARSQPAAQNDDPHEENLPKKEPRPGNLWVTGGSARRLGKEPVEFAAGGVEGALRLFGTVVDGGAAVFMDGAAEKTVGRHFS